MFHRPHLRVVLLIVFIGGLSATADSSEPSGPKVGRVRLGLEGAYKLGHWVPAEFEVIGGSEQVQAQLSLRVPDGDQVPTLVTAAEGLELPAGERIWVPVTLRVGRVSAGLEARLSYQDQEGQTHLVRQRYSVDESDAAETIPQPLGPRQPVILVLGPEVGFLEMVNAQSWAEGEKPVVIPIDQIRQLPTHWSAYESVSLLVLNTSSSRLQDEPAERQTSALLNWVRQGGRVLLSLGADFTEQLASDPLAGRLLPGRVDRVYVFQSSRGLDSFVGAETSLLRDSRESLSVLRLDELQGTSLAQQSGVPLVIRGCFGFGSTTTCTVDLTSRLIAQWPHRDQLLLKLAELEPRQGQAEAGSQTYMRTQINDLSSELMVGLEKFSGVPLVSVALVALLLALYAAVIGPLDFLLIRKLTGQPMLTWVTLPIVIIGVSVLAIRWSTELKGDSVKVNQAAVIDIDLTNQQLRGTAWLDLYTPTTRQFDLQIQPNELADSAETLVGWLGLPEREAIGGMYQPPSLLVIADAPYQMGLDLPNLKGLRVQAASTKPLTSRWQASLADSQNHQPTNSQRKWLEASVIRPPGGGKVASVELTSHLPFPLTDCLLCYRDRCYPLQNNAPDAQSILDPEVPVFLQLSRSSSELLKDKLREVRQVRTIGGQLEERTVGFETGRGRIPAVLKLMMFYRAVEGKQYTGLSNQYQQFVDLSGTLAADGVVLLGRADTQAVEVHDAGEPLGNQGDQQVTYFRFVLPWEGQQ